MNELRVLIRHLERLSTQPMSRETREELAAAFDAAEERLDYWIARVETLAGMIEAAPIRKVPEGD